MKRPLVVLSIAYCLGIILADLTRINFWIIIIVSIVVFIPAVFLRPKSLLLMGLILFLTLLIGYANQRNSWILSNCHIRKFVSYKNSALCTLEGVIVSQPEFRNNHCWFILRAKQIQLGKIRSKCCGEVLIKIYFQQSLNYGDNLTLIGQLSQPFSFGNHRGYRDFLAQQNIYLIMLIKDYRQIIRLDKINGSGLIGSCFGLRIYLEKIIQRHLAALPSSMLAAMVLGQKRDIPWLVNDSMVKSGTVHILVVSGFNVGIVAFIVNLLLKILRLPRKLRIILTAFFLFSYCLITGASNPVVRATVMGLVFLAAYFFKRQPDIYNSLASAALFILAINPRQLFNIGFQLSFISVLAIVFIYPKLKKLLHLDNFRIKVLKLLIEGCLVSLSAWIGTVVIIAWNFRMVSLVTVLANILIVPLATLITLCGFVLVLSGLIYPDLADLFSLLTTVLVTLLLNINAALIRLPFAFFYF